METPGVGDKEVAGAEFHVLVFMVEITGAGEHIAGLKIIVPVQTIARHVRELDLGKLAKQQFVGHFVHGKRKCLLAEKVN